MVTFFSICCRKSITFEKNKRDFLLQDERKSGTSNASLAGMSKTKYKKQRSELCHFRKDCPKEDTEAKPSQKPSNTGKQKVLSAFCVDLNNVNTTEKSSIVFNNNGANEHLFNDKSWSNELRPAFGKVRMPNDNVEPIVAAGEVYLRKNDQYTLVLNAKYVPGQNANQWIQAYEKWLDHQPNIGTNNRKNWCWRGSCHSGSSEWTVAVQKIKADSMESENIKGIKCDLTVPHRPQKNGVAERINIKLHGKVIVD